ncbi:MAG: hypothetical protein K5985_04355 [Lachnospiraceae bacterium]|nr:hypothetical protein [Lachnospiraceae bacterium]
MRFVWAAVGILIIAAFPLHERAVNALWENCGAGAGLKKKRSEENEAGEDLLDNKKKWRILIAGYCIFVLFMIFAALSIYTLNQKINNLSESTKELKVTIQQMEQTR